MGWISVGSGRADGGEYAPEGAKNGAFDGD
jgi:hypothetical protein